MRLLLVRLWVLMVSCVVVMVSEEIEMGVEGYWVKGEGAATGFMGAKGVLYW